MTQLAKLLGLGITDTAIEKWEKNQNRPTDAHRKQIIKRSEEHTSELQSQSNLVCRLLLEKKKIFQFSGFIAPHPFSRSARCAAVRGPKMNVASALLRAVLKTASTMRPIDTPATPLADTR